MNFSIAPCMNASSSVRCYNRGMSTWGLYVPHSLVQTRCHYCAFNTYVDNNPPFEAYTDAVIAQWDHHCKDFESPHPPCSSEEEPHRSTPPS